ncbi:MAG: hypothetical protein N3F05_04380 [Candidatus Diapherotrites archaeon]|nr:hypothetical protein [Candidatus Diapherotrites archaeon]
MFDYFRLPKQLAKDISLVFLVWILINYQFVLPVYAADESSDEKKAAPIRDKFTCEMGQLSKEDSFKILKLLAEGLTGSKIASSTKQDTNKDREKLENPTIIIPIDANKGEAAKVPVADEKFNISEAIHLTNDWISGPYAFGLVLTDTLRVGRCNNLEDKNIPCPVVDKQLTLRNSGEGIVSDFKPLTDILAIKGKKPEDFTEEEYKEIREKLGLPEDAQDELEMRIAASDFNEINIQAYKRAQGKMIPNSILTYTFNAYGQTTCNSSDCTITIYSLFDKYYNNWFSMEMTFSTFGPTLVGQARKLFQHLGVSKTFLFRLSETELADRLRRSLYNSDALFGRRLRARMKMRAQQYPEVAKFTKELTEGKGWTSGYELLTNPSIPRTVSSDWLGAGGWMSKIDDPIVKRELYRQAKDIEKFTKTQRAFLREAKENYLKAAKSGLGSPQEMAARVEYGKTISEAMLDYTDTLSLDVPGWFSKYSPVGLYTQNIKGVGDVSPAWIAGDSAYMYDMLKKYSIDGHFGGGWPGNAYHTEGKNLVLYRLVPEEAKIKDITFDELQKGWFKYEGFFVQTDSGVLLPVNETSLNTLKTQMTGAKPLFSLNEVKKKPTGRLTPEDFATKLMETKNTLQLEIFAPESAEKITQILQARGFELRRYSSLLDRAIAYQDNFIHNYMRPAGGLKWTALFNMYWVGKRGLNQKFASAYMLPDTWREVRWPLGQGEIYDDAFIDFFSHEGSDQGDMFRRLMSLMPWEWLMLNTFEKFEPVKNMYERLTGSNVRTSVENLAIYATTPQDCTNCGILMRSGMDYRYYFTNFYSGRKIDSYILEDAVSENVKNWGSTLIMFSRHTDLEGKEKNVSGSSRISLEEAVKKKKTCADAVEEATMGISKYIGIGTLFKPHTIGGALALTDSLGYALFGFGAVFGTLAQQLVIAPKLQDCVDVDGGYYTHIFVPAKKEDKGKAASQLSAETAMNSIRSFVDSLTSMFKSNSNSYTAKAATELDEKVKKFTSGAKQDNIVQANVHLEGPTTGILQGEELFSFWFKGESTPTTYKTEGQKVIASDNNRAIIVDFKNGRILLVDQNGNILDVITENDVPSRLISTNTDIPAEEIPKRYTLVGLPDSNDPMFEMNIDSELIVLIPEISECILKGIEYQSGLEYKQADLKRLNLTDVFGKVLAITTDTHTIKAVAEQKRIVAEGMPRTMVESQNAKAIVLANRETKIKDGKEEYVGLFESVQFENGVILYKPDTHELIIWLKRNKQAELSGNDVGGIKLSPAQVVDPETNCPVPAVSLQAIPKETEGIGAYRVEQFNKSLAASGPFNVLETPTRRFVFFAKYEPDGKCSGLECCKNYIRVINKETGEVYEAPIETFQVRPDGIYIKDGKGNEHNIKITADDGKPMLQYNNYPPEPLTSAQGPNGSFWYDPTANKWYAENAQLLPLLEAFRAGALTQAGAGGVVTKAGDNILNVSGLGSSGGFNLPSLPEDVVFLVVYLSLLLTTITTTRTFLSRNSKKNFSMQKQKDFK